MDINEEYLTNDKKDSSFNLNPSTIFSKAKSAMNLKNFQKFQTIDLWDLDFDEKNKAEIIAKIEDERNIFKANQKLLLKKVINFEN